MANEQDLLSPENIARVNASLPDEMRCAWDRSGMTDDQRVEARLAAFRKDYGDVLPDFGGGMVRAAVSGSLTWPDAEREILRAEVRAMKLREIRAHYATAPAIHGSSRDTNQEILQAALCLNTGALKEPEKQFTPQVLEAASSPAYRHFGLQQLLVAAAMENGFTARPGEGVNRGNLRAVLEYAFPARPAITAGFSTHSITTMLSTVGNKILLDGFAAAPQKWREIAATKTVTDFKQTTAFRMTADLEYEELPPAGEIKHGTLGQESYTMQARTYAKMLTLTRTEIINDDLGAFDDLRNRLGIGAVIKMNKIFWTAWINNVAFFTAERGNYMEGAATTLDETGLNAAVKLFRDLQSPDGDTLDLEPAILLVPSDLEATALKWYNATEIRNPAADTPTPTENIFKGRFRPVVVPQLSRSAYTGYSAKAWYLLADPKILATAAMCFLNGMESPTIESADADFNTLGIQFRGYHDFGVSMTEYRAGVKIKGEV